MIHTLCLLLSLVFALLATAGVPEPPHLRFLPASVLFLVLSMLLPIAGLR